MDTQLFMWIVIAAGIVLAVAAGVLVCRQFRVSARKSRAAVVITALTFSRRRTA